MEDEQLEETKYLGVIDILRKHEERIERLTNRIDSLAAEVGGLQAEVANLRH